MVKFLLDLVHGMLADRVTLIRAVDDFNVYKSTVNNAADPENSSSSTPNEFTLRFHRGSVIQLVKGEPNESEWTGASFDSAGDAMVGTFPSSMVRKITPREWSCKSDRLHN